MTVTSIKNGGQAIIDDLDDCYYYIHQYMGGDFLRELKNCIEPINVQNDLDATKYELESYLNLMKQTLNRLNVLLQILRMLLSAFLDWGEFVNLKLLQTLCKRLSRLQTKRCNYGYSKTKLPRLS